MSSNHKTRFLEELRRSVTSRSPEKMIDWLQKTDFFGAPASTRFHCAWQGGLCEHSLNVYDELKRIAAAYPEVHVSDESIAICALLHDVCKANTYKVETRNRKVDGVWIQEPFYTFQEDFSFGGHGSKSVWLIEKCLPLTEEEAVAINCHMGNEDGKYTCSKSYEAYPLAWMLHVADEAATLLIEPAKESVYGKGF